MSRNVRYETLAMEEDTEAPTEAVSVAVSVSPDGPTPPAADDLPSYAEANPQTEGATGESPQETAAPDAKIPEPPSYNIATSLPTYEEAEETKQREAEEAARNQETAPSSQRMREVPVGDIQLGTDGVFLCTFILAFLFNWVGLMASLCFSQSIAGRMGALAGFGLSLVKWVAIVKHNNLAHTVAAGDSWIWWMLIIMGLLIFFRGCLQYIRIKYQWNSLSQLRDRIYMQF